MLHAQGLPRVLFPEVDPVAVLRGAAVPLLEGF